MSADRTHDSLTVLVDMHEREVDRLSADVAVKRTTRERYVRNLTRLEELSSGSGPSGAPVRGTPGAPLSPTLSLNCGDYKQTVMRMADSHRVDLALLETELARAQGALAGAARRHTSFDMLLRRNRERAVRAENRREQKRQDETAFQMWCRKRSSQGPK